MNKPYISIIVPTTRIGGLDVLFSGLEIQTFKDFELILVDSLYDKRKDLIEKQKNKYSFVIKHLYPKNEKLLTATGYCNAINTGLINAEGTIVFFMCDYTWLDPSCLQIHADFHQNEKQEKNTALLCSYNYTKLPILHDNLIGKRYAHDISYAVDPIRYADEELKCFTKYNEDINSGKLNSLMWSIFDSQFTTLDDPKNLIFDLTDVKSSLKEGFVGMELVCLKNESYPLDILIEINGLNEALDGSHGWQDMEFADRLTTVAGTKLYAKPIITATTINPRSIIDCRLRTRGIYDNELIWKTGKEAEFKNKINGISKEYKKMKIAFLFGAWSVGSRPLNFFGNNINISSRGLSGSDLGVIITAVEFAKLGHDVSLFTVHTPGTKPDCWQGVKLYNVEDEDTIIDSSFDVVISWSEPDKLRKFSKKQIKVVCMMLNDFTYCQPRFDDAVDLWTIPCQMLQDHLLKQPGAPLGGKCHIVPLGADPTLYSDDKRVSGRVVWTSSPDRGLFWLLSEWSKIKIAVPHASLRIFYNFNYDSVEQMEPNSNNHPHFLELGNRARYMKEAIKKLKQLNVEHVGSISREQMINELNEAQVLAFPCDTIAWTEGFSIALLESCSAGVLPITSNVDCLGSIYGGIIPMIEAPVQHNIGKFTDLVIRGLVDDIWREKTVQKCKEFSKQYTWKKSAKKLEDVILEYIRNKNET